MLGIFNRNHPKVDLEWIAKQEEPVRFTPDVWRLGRAPTWRLFVYGEELWTLPIEGECLGRAYTKENFSLWKSRLGEATWPFALEENATHISGAQDLLIQGQLWLVSPEMLVTLDNYYSNTVQFERRRVRIHYPYMRTFWSRSLGILKDDFDVEEYSAFMYVGKTDYFAPKLEELYNTPLNKRPKQQYAPVRSYKPRSPYLQDYYYFSYLEYEPIIPVQTSLSEVSFE